MGKKPSPEQEKSPGEEVDELVALLTDDVVSPMIVEIEVSVAYFKKETNLKFGLK